MAQFCASAARLHLAASPSFKTGVYPAADECHFTAAAVEWPRSVAASAGSNQEKLGGDAMTEKTVRPHSVLRRTMLAGTAGVLGGAVLRPTPVQSQTGTAPAVAVPAARRPERATAIRRGGRNGKRKSWSRRSRSSIRTIICGTKTGTATCLTSCSPTPAAVTTSHRASLSNAARCIAPMGGRR